MPDPARAPLLIRAFEMMATGKYKKTEVLNALADEGLKTHKGKPLTPQTFQIVLRNSLYAGWVTLPSDKTFEPVRGRHEPLVNQETFDRVQAVLDGRKVGAAPRRKVNPAFPLKCFVMCEACGTPLTGGFCAGRSKAYPYYWCRNRNCRAVKLRGEQLEADFGNLPKRLRAKEDAISKFPSIAAKAWDSKQSDSITQFKRLEARLEEKRDRKHRLLNSMLDGTITRETYVETNEMLVRDIAATEEELRTLKNQRADRDAFIRFAELGLLDMLISGSSPSLSNVLGFKIFSSKRA